MAMMAARFPGVCSVCGERFPAGTAIVWTKAGKTTAHEVCPGLAAAAVPVVTVAATSAGPVWLPAAAGESQTETGRRAVLFLLQAGQYASWQLADATIEQAQAACSVLASQARRDDVATVEALADLQGYLRSIGRARAVAVQILAEQFAALMGPESAAGAAVAPTPDAGTIAPPAASQGPAAGPTGNGGGGGGSKVPRRPRPTGGAPAAGLAVPVAAVPAAMLAPVAALPPVMALPALSGDDLF